MVSRRPYAAPLRRTLTHGVRGWAKEISGVAAIEAALVLPIFFLFCMGFFEIGRSIWIQTNLQYAVADAARCAALGSSNCADVPAYAASRMFGVTVAATTFAYSPNAVCGSSGSATGFKVTASYKVQTMFFGTAPALNNITLKASACRP